MEREDTESFVENLYMDSAEINYSSNYVDKNYLDRVKNIYAPKVSFLLDSITPNKNIGVLDVGCGSGHLVCAMLDSGIEAKGIDISSDMVKYGNTQISLLHGQTPLIEGAELELIKSIKSTEFPVISAIGVIEHLREPHKFFEAFHNSSADYLYACVPMFSLSVYIENIFPSVYPRNLSGGHTHIFSNKSLEWLYENFQLELISEWRFGSDIADLLRCFIVSLQNNKTSKKFIGDIEDLLWNKMDSLQQIIDESDFSSEIHFIVKKKKQL